MYIYSGNKDTSYYIYTYTAPTKIKISFPFLLLHSKSSNIFLFPFKLYFTNYISLYGTGTIRLQRKHSCITQTNAYVINSPLKDTHIHTQHTHTHSHSHSHDMFQSCACSGTRSLSDPA